MKIRITPVFKIFTQIKFKTKALIISAVFLIPLIASLFVLISQINEEKNLYNNKEIGAIYIQKAFKLMQAAQNNRALNDRFQEGDIITNELYLESREALQQAFNDVEQQTKGRIPQPSR